MERREHTHKKTLQYRNVHNIYSTSDFTKNQLRGLNYL